MKQRKNSSGTDINVNGNIDGNIIVGNGNQVSKTIKNVIQTIIHLPAWAWVTGAILLSGGLCIAIVIGALGAAAIFNVGPLGKLLPTPMAFAPAITGQSLIIVADLDDRSSGRYSGIDPAQYVFEQLQAQIKKDKLDVRVERLHQVVDDNTAKPAGVTYNATLVVWGWYDALTITPRITRIKTLQGDISTEEGQRLSMVDPDKVEFSVVTDLPSQTTYLVMFTIAIDKFSNSNFNDAFTYFDSAIQAASANTKTSTNPSESYLYRAYIYEEIKGDYDRALADQDKAIQLKPDNENAYYNRGITYYHKGDYDRAIADDDMAIQLKPDFVQAYYNRGVAYSYKSDYDRAIADYNKAIQLEPDFAQAYNNRGNTYNGKGDYDRAIPDFNKAIQLNPDDAYAYNNRGSAYNGKGAYDRAILDFNKAIQLEPDFANAYNNRGNAYSDKGDFDRAIADYNKAIQLEPDNADFYFNRGISYYSKGDYDHAIADYSKVIQLKPDYINAYRNRGYIYELQGRNNDAIDDIEHFLELTSDPELRIEAEYKLLQLRGK